MSTPDPQPDRADQNALAAPGSTDPALIPLDGTFAPGPPEVQPLQLHPDPEPPARSGLVLRLARFAGIDRAVGFTVLARGWSSLAGLGTLTLIARFLTPAQQGFYYTFYSLVALQIMFELGFSVVILQTASHESAYLVIASDGSITGPEPEHSRLASLLQKSVRWYTFAAIAMAISLIPVGIKFFRHASDKAGGDRVHFVLPWILVVVASSCTFQIDPLFSFLEGCGYVPEVARTRLRQSMMGTLLGWTVFFLHLGLYAPGCMILGQAIAGAVFLYSKRGLLLPLLRRSVGNFHINWRTEIWPFQWRIAVSWMSGYLAFQLYNPILMNYRGAVEAGQMGMSLNVCGTLSTMAVAWMNTKAAPFGRLIAKKEYRRLDQTFARALVQSSLAALLASSAVWITVVWMQAHQVRFHGTVLSSRLLPPVPLAMLLFGMVGNIVVFGEALYLRAHKQEKFMIPSLISAIYSVPVAFALGSWKAPHGGAWGIAAAYAVGTVIFGLGYGTYTFWKWRGIWHAL